MNNKKRLELHEKVFHKLYIARLTYNDSRMLDILSLIGAYCFATNGSNGMQTEYEIRKAQDRMLLKLEKL